MNSGAVRKGVVAFLLLGLVVVVGCGGETPRPRQAGLASSGLEPLSRPSSAPAPERLAAVQGISLCVIVKSAPAEAEKAQYAQASMLLVTEPSADLVRSLRKQFPQATVLSLRDVRPSAESAALPASEAQENWFLASQGAPLGVGAPEPERLYDLSSSGAREALAAALTQQMQDATADGLYLRGVRPVSSEAEVSSEGGAREQVAFPGVRELIAAVRGSAPRAPMIVEADLGDAQRLQPLLTEADGMALRIPVGWEASAGSKWLTALWSGVRDTAQALAKGKRHLVLVPVWPTDKAGKPQESDQAVRQLAAVYLLAWFDRASLCIEPSLLRKAGLDPSLRIGAPKDKAAEKEGLLSREFDKVWAFLNLGSGEAPVPHIEGTVDLAGEAAPKSLAPGAALVLIPVQEKVEEEPATGAGGQ